jgi:ribose transport system ATP-binding protein/rhamnose transport system ATP-binding protein
VLDLLGLHKSLDTPAERLSVADAWVVSIGRALMRDARLIAMDEPTASLSAEECTRLFGVVKGLAARGVCVLYVSHRLNEVVDLCERVTVFRDGRVVDTLVGSAIDKPALVRGMVGSVPLATNSSVGTAPRGPSPDPVLSLRGLRRAPLVRDVDLDLMPGEVVGLTGLVGSGRTEVARMIFGADRPDGGEMMLDGRSYHPRSVVQAIRSGVALVPEERRSQGLFLDKSIDFNISLPTMRSVRSGPLRLLSGRRRAARAARMVKELDIKTRSTDTLVRQLSGGNQQKVVMAKWLVDGCKVLLLDEPSRGVDVSARAEIYRVIRRQAAQGTAVLVISSEFDELTNCDRVVVMREGRLTANLRADQVSESVVLAASFADHDTDRNADPGPDVTSGLPA